MKSQPQPAVVRALYTYHRSSLSPEKPRVSGSAPATYGRGGAETVGPADLLSLPGLSPLMPPSSPASPRGSAPGAPGASQGSRRRPVRVLTARSSPRAAQAPAAAQQVGTAPRPRRPETPGACPPQAGSACPPAPGMSGMETQCGHRPATRIRNQPGWDSPLHLERVGARGCLGPVGRETSRSAAAPWRRQREPLGPGADEASARSLSRRPSSGRRALAVPEPRSPALCAQSGPRGA
ncbi:translation initiation factor IF-2-like [Canis lupus familiaris]|uniref:translation initiation factor IF-2-like n=1 Tax=Canis lupus familiaris TaxID=9615 RepID=UPI0015F135DF|nr:translation initiation factor IF-2-like [Canis lupus familiaris]